MKLVNGSKPRLASGAALWSAISQKNLRTKYEKQNLIYRPNMLTVIVTQLIAMSSVFVSVPFFYNNSSSRFSIVFWTGLSVLSMSPSLIFRCYPLVMKKRALIGELIGDNICPRCAHALHVMHVGGAKQCFECGSVWEYCRAYP